MGAFDSGALTVLITFNHLYPMIVAKSRNSAIHLVRDIPFTAVVGRLEALVLLGNRKSIGSVRPELARIFHRSYQLLVEFTNLINSERSADQNR